MSKQIAILLDNSGSMWDPVGGANVFNKIHEASRGAQFFIQNLIDHLGANPGAQFAISVHRFADTYQVLPGGGQVDTGNGNLNAALTSLKNAIPQIENAAATQAAVGVMTDIYDGVRRTADFLMNGANQPSFGAPSSRVIVLFTDGIQTIPHGGGLTMANYQGEQGVTFSNLLNGRQIRLIAWGVGSNALGVVLDELKNQAFPGATNPVSSSKVLFPFGATPGCDTTIMNAAFAVVDNNGILPLNPIGEPPFGLLWEQFSLPYWALTDNAGFTPATTHVSRQRINFKDFEVLVDGSTRELILGLTWHAPGTASVQATSPSGAVFAPGTAGTRSLSYANGLALKIPNPEEGTWQVRVSGDAKQAPLVLDLMARGILREFSLQVDSEPFQIMAPGSVKVIAWPRWDGKPAEGKLTATALVLGGDLYDLERQKDGSFVGPVKIARPGMTPIRVEVQGKLEKAGSIRRIEFTAALLGRATDPRFTLNPDTYEQGGSYTVDVQLQDAQFGHASQIRFGDGIAVTSFQVLNDSEARAAIQVAADAFVGARVPVTFAPEAESFGAVKVVESRDGHGPSGRICCLRFDAAGKLVAVVLCDGREVCVTIHDGRIQRILEAARDQNLSVKISVDGRGCLTGVTICR